MHGNHKERTMTCSEDMLQVASTPMIIPSLAAHMTIGGHCWMGDDHMLLFFWFAFCFSVLAPTVPINCLSPISKLMLLIWNDMHKLDLAQSPLSISLDNQKKHFYQFINLLLLLYLCNMKCGGCGTDTALNTHASHCRHCHACMVQCGWSRRRGGTWCQDGVQCMLQWSHSWQQPAIVIICKLNSG